MDLIYLVHAIETLYRGSNKHCKGFTQFYKVKGGGGSAPPPPPPLIIFEW